MSQLLKVPLLLLAAVSNQIATTPPHPPAARSDKVPSSILEEFLRVSAPRFLVYSSWWTATFVEILSIVLTNESPHPSSLSYHLLHHLHSNGGSLSSIRITPLFLLGIGMVYTGALIRWLSYRALGRFFTFELTVQEDHRLITTGPYAYVRHPGYSAILLCVTGTFLTFAAPGSWIWESGILSKSFGKPLLGTLAVLPLAITMSLLKRMPQEEMILRKEFKGEWERWAKEVPYKLVPYVY